MADVLITCVLEPTSGLPRDQVVNTFTVQPGPLVDPIDIGDQFTTFYESISPFLAPSVSDLNVYAAEITNLSTGTLTPKDFIGASVLAGISGDPLPQEVAICLSFRSPASISPAGRSRGRVYLGPWNTDASDTGTSAGEFARPASPCVTAISDAAATLVSALDTLGAPWMIWSRADADLKQVTEGWIDNEFDTVRSRGRRSDSRAQWAL